MVNSLPLLDSLLLRFCLLSKHSWLYEFALSGLPGTSRQYDTAADVFAFGICTLEVGNDRYKKYILYQFRSPYSISYSNKHVK